MKHLPRDARPRAHLVTEARPPLSEDISYRERRYLIMMGIRVVFFVLAVVLFANGLGWFALIPAVGAVVIPYFAVVLANGGREPSRHGALHDVHPVLGDRSDPALESRPVPPHVVGFVTRLDTHPGSDTDHTGGHPAQAGYGGPVGTPDPDKPLHE